MFPATNCLYDFFFFFFFDIQLFFIDEDKS